MTKAGSTVRKISKGNIIRKGSRSRPAAQADATIVMPGEVIGASAIIKQRFWATRQ